MTLWNLGSINEDLVFTVPHIPAPGETLSSTSQAAFLGGKGANMSVAAARAGGTVQHIGAIGRGGHWAIERFERTRVGTDHIHQVDHPMGQALIFVADDGENAIVLNSGANKAIELPPVEAALGNAARGDWFVTQNETNLQVEAMALAKKQGLRTAYAAAPFEAEAVVPLLPMLDFLILNAVEADQLEAAIGRAPQNLGVRDVVVTLGSDGAHWFGHTGKVKIDAVPVTPVDTTGAGDTFTGYLLAGLDLGRSMEDALREASRAAALMVTRHGTADVIPWAEDVDQMD